MWRSVIPRFLIFEFCLRSDLLRGRRSHGHTWRSPRSSCFLLLDCVGTLRCFGSIARDIEFQRHRAGDHTRSGSSPPLTVAMVSSTIRNCRKSDGLKMSMQLGFSGRGSIADYSPCRALKPILWYEFCIRKAETKQEYSPPTTMISNSLRLGQAHKEQPSGSARLRKRAPRQDVRTRYVGRMLREASAIALQASPVAAGASTADTAQSCGPRTPHALALTRAFCTP